MDVFVTSSGRFDYCFYVPNLDVPELSERLFHALEFLIQGWILKLKECVIHVKYQ